MIKPRGLKIGAAKIGKRKTEKGNRPLNYGFTQLKINGF
jgi:hypothetical protein